MKITRIAVYHLLIPIQGKPYKLSGGRVFTEFDSTVVSLETDDGVTGWGEACPFGPIYGAAFGAGIRAAMEILAPAVLGLDPLQAERVYDAMDRALQHTGFAKSAIDIACWDIAGKVAGRPLVDLLGGRAQLSPRLISSVSTGTPDEMLAVIARFRGKGYRAHSAKAGGDPAEDVERFRAIDADNAARGDYMQADANRGWALDQALRFARGIAECDMVIEQPCQTIEECAELRRRTGLPVMLDEMVCEVPDLLRAIEHRACDAINIKITRMGGLSRARQIRDLCSHAGLSVSVQDTGGADIAAAAMAHLAQSTPTRIFRGAWDPRELAGVSNADGGPMAADGTIAVSDAPGLGVTPKLDVLGEPIAVYD